jgi:hypothetical protein
VRQAWQQRLQQKMRGASAQRSEAYKAIELGLVDVMYLKRLATEHETHMAAKDQLMKLCSMYVLTFDCEAAKPYKGRKV